MNNSASEGLAIPAHLFGSYTEVGRKARAEGRRCATAYRKTSSFPPPHEMRLVNPGDVVYVEDVVDFDRGQPRWRLYRVDVVLDAICREFEGKDSHNLSDEFESFCRQAPWGALYVAVTNYGLRSSERVSKRLAAVLQFWDVLASARYRYGDPDAALSFEELMSRAYGWAVDVWAKPGDATLRSSLQATAGAMARATVADCIEACVRQVHQTIASLPPLKHRDVLSRPSFLRERLAALSPEAFEEISAATPGSLRGQLLRWDEHLGAH